MAGRYTLAQMTARLDRIILLFLILLGANDLALAIETPQEFPVPHLHFPKGCFLAVIAMPPWRSIPRGEN